MGSKNILSVKKFSGITLFVGTILLACQSFALSYPTGPDSRLTSGDLCQHGDTFRYPEQIQYCNRSVSSHEKWDVINSYEAIGYDIKSLGRQNFKIDHLIPLCMGGSNEPENLWPQYKDIFSQTDKIEQLSCELMANGALLQADAVVLILDTKAHLEKAADVQADLEEKMIPFRPIK